VLVHSLISKKRHIHHNMNTALRRGGGEQWFQCGQWLIIINCLCSLFKDIMGDIGDSVKEEFIRTDIAKFHWFFVLDSFSEDSNISGI
jgi:hypothetical protein